jgi:rubrerythrin
MNDFIKRSDALALAEKFSETDMDETDYVSFYMDLEDLPSADVVERKRGKWMPAREDVSSSGMHDKTEWYGYVFECNLCGEHLMIDEETRPNYCPNCGAEMEKLDEMDQH